MAYKAISVETFSDEIGVSREVKQLIRDRVPTLETGTLQNMHRFLEYISENAGHVPQKPSLTKMLISGPVEDISNSNDQAVAISNPIPWLGYSVSDVYYIAFLLGAVDIELQNRNNGVRPKDGSTLPSQPLPLPRP